MRVRAAIAAVLAGALAVVLIGVVGAGAQGGQQSKALFAVLTGAKEPGGGDPNGRGSFTAIVDGNRLCYGLTNRNIEDPAAAHIHRGRSGVAGDVVVPLQQPSSGDPGASSDCVRVARSLARAILANPNRYYVNVHTAGLPDGAIRGQLFARQR
jgi:CHRD domain-containing protein